MAGCPDGDPRGHDGPPRAGAHVGMHPAHQRGGTANRSRSAALGSLAGRLPAHRQPPAGPGAERNGTVTRAGGRGPRSRPRHRQRIRQDHPQPPDRHQLHREPSVMCSSRRRPPSSGPDQRGRTSGPLPTACSSPRWSQRLDKDPGQCAARVRPTRAHHLNLPLCRRSEELRRYAASSTRASAMLFATGVAVLPAWLIWTGRIRLATHPRIHADTCQRTQGERKGQSRDVPQLPRLYGQGRRHTVRAARRSALPVHHELHRRPAGKRQDQLPAPAPLQRAH